MGKREVFIFFSPYSSIEIKWTPKGVIAKKFGNYILVYIDIDFKSHIMPAYAYNAKKSSLWVCGRNVDVTTWYGPSMSAPEKLLNNTVLKGPWTCKMES